MELRLQWEEGAGQQLLLFLLSQEVEEHLLSLTLVANWENLHIRLSSFSVSCSMMREVVLLPSEEERGSLASEGEVGGVYPPPEQREVTSLLAGGEVCFRLSVFGAAVVKVSLVLSEEEKEWLSFETW